MFFSSLSTNLICNERLTSSLKKKGLFWYLNDRKFLSYFYSYICNLAGKKVSNVYFCREKVDLMLLFFRNFFGLILKNTVFLGIINRAGGEDYAFIYVITMITASVRYKPKIVWILVIFLQRYRYNISFFSINSFLFIIFIANIF